MIRRRVPPQAEQTDEAPKGFDDFDLRLGDVLRGERATLGKSLLDVQRELKIKANYIAAIENADPAAFESPGFIPGYVRSYARYLNLDPEWAYEAFCSEANFAVNPKQEASGGLNMLGGGLRASAKPTQVNVPAGRQDPFKESTVSFVPKDASILSNIEPRAIGSTLVLLALIGALGYGGWTVLQQVQRVTVTPVDQPPGVFAEVDPLSAPTFPSSVESTGDVAPKTPDALDRLYLPQALDAPVMVARDGPIGAIDPTGPSAGPDNPEAARRAELAALQAERATAPGSDSVVVMAVRPAWVQVSDTAGTVIFEETLGSSGTYIVPQDGPELVLRAGAAGGVYFAVNGKVYGPAGPSGTVADAITLEEAEIEERFQVADLSLDPALVEVLERQKAEGTLVAEARDIDLPLPRVLADGPEVVKVVAAREAWVRVRASDGTVLFSEVMQPGAVFEIPADVTDPDLRTGSAGAVYLSFGGVPYGPLGATGEVKNVSNISREVITAGYAQADLDADPDLRDVLVAESQ